MDTSPFQLAQPSYSSDEGEAHTPSRSRSTSSQSRRVVGFPALSTSDDWSPVSILQREGQGRGSEPPKQPMSRASSLSEALQQQHALQQAHLQPLGPRRLSIKTTASAKSSGGGRGLALQLQRAQSSQQAPTQPAAGAWGLPAPPALHPFDATAPTGSELLRSSPLSRQASANVEIPRLQKAQTAPTGLDDDIIAAALHASQAVFSSEQNTQPVGSNHPGTAAAAAVGTPPHGCGHAGGSPRGLQQQQQQLRDRCGSEPLGRSPLSRSQPGAAAGVLTSAMQRDGQPVAPSAAAGQRGAQGMVAAAAARRLQRGQGSLQPASEALQRGGSLQLERAASATEQLFHVQADATTAMAQVHCLNEVLNKERGELDQLRAELKRVTLERDELREGAAQHAQHAAAAAATLGAAAAAPSTAQQSAAAASGVGGRGLVTRSARSGRGLQLRSGRSGGRGGNEAPATRRDVLGGLFEVGGLEAQIPGQQQQLLHGQEPPGPLELQLQPQAQPQVQLQAKGGSEGMEVSLELGGLADLELSLQLLPVHQQPLQQPEQQLARRSAQQPPLLQQPRGGARQDVLGGMFEMEQVSDEEEPPPQQAQQVPKVPSFQLLPPPQQQEQGQGDFMSPFGGFGPFTPSGGSGWQRDRMS